MKIGVVLITYNRFNRFKECFENLLKNRRDIDKIVIVEDFSDKDRNKYDEYFKNILFNDIQIIKNTENKGVGKSKNKGLKTLFDEGFDYVFTLEDDINVINPDVFKEYIDTAEKTGYHYINFGLHGKLNVGRKVLAEKNGKSFWLFPECVGAFSLHSKKLIDEVGYYDSFFYNAMEHVDYYYRASLKELATPFNYFIDIANSDEYLQEQEASIDDSSIRPREDWLDNINNALKYWGMKHGKTLTEVRLENQRS